MLRLAFNHIAKPIELSSLASGFCTRAPIQRRIREVNNVKIIGTLISDAYTLPSGHMAITVKTRDSATTYSNHNIHLKTTPDLVTGQRIYVCGKLSSKRIVTGEGKSLTASVVKAYDSYVLENEGASVGSTDGDVNQVEILANIASDILNKDTHSTFSIATHFQARNVEEGESPDKVSFHRVFVYDQELREYVRNELQTKDRVLLNGRIGHMTDTGNDGKKIYSGFLVVNDIYKIARRTSTRTEINDSKERFRESGDEK